MVGSQADVTDYAALDARVRLWLAETHDNRIWLLDGDLGAGKTTTIKAFCNALGVVEEVTSPTYSLVHTYHSSQGPVHHIDLYRLTSVEEAYEAGIYECLTGDAYCFVEWAERLPSLRPEVYMHLHLTVADNGLHQAKLTSSFTHA